MSEFERRHPHESVWRARETGASNQLAFRASEHHPMVDGFVVAGFSGFIAYGRRVFRPL